MNLWERKNRKQFVSFLEKPIYQHEIKLADFLSLYFASLNKPINGIKKFFVPDAIVSSYLDGEKELSREEYETLMQEKSSVVHGIFCDGITFIKKSDAEIKVTGTLSVLRDSAAQPNKFIYIDTYINTCALFCKMISNDWFISKIEYRYQKVVAGKFKSFRTIEPPTTPE